MWPKNVLCPLWPKNAKPKSKIAWRKKALAIDTRKTTLAIEKENTDSENLPTCIDKNQLNLAVPESLLTVADLSEDL